MVKNLPATQEVQEIRVRSLGWEDPLEEELATHSSILAWRIPIDRGAWRAWGCSSWGCKEWDTTKATKHSIYIYIYIYIYTLSYSLYMNMYLYVYIIYTYMYIKLILTYICILTKSMYKYILLYCIYYTYM